MVMYKIDRRGGGAQKSFSRTDPVFEFVYIDQFKEFLNSNIRIHISKIVGKKVYLQMIFIELFKLNKQKSF